MIATTEAPPHLFDLICRLLDNQKHIRFMAFSFSKERDRASKR